MSELSEVTDVWSQLWTWGAAYNTYDRKERRAVVTHRSGFTEVAWESPDEANLRTNPRALSANVDHALRDLVGRLRTIVEERNKGKNNGK